MLDLHNGKHYMNMCRNFSLGIVLKLRLVGNYRLMIHSSIRLQYGGKNGCQALSTEIQKSEEAFSTKHNN